jgi:hypothetical protein
MVYPTFIRAPGGVLTKARTSKEEAKYMEDKGVAKTSDLYYKQIELREDGGTEKSASKVKGFFSLVNQIIALLGKLAEFFASFSPEMERGIEDLADRFVRILLSQTLQNTGKKLLLYEVKDVTPATNKLLVQLGYIVPKKQGAVAAEAGDEETME